MIDQLNRLTTEMRNEATQNLDSLSTREVVELMNREDQTVAYAVEKELERIGKAVDLIVESMEKGGRLFYFGAGTSGRLGVLDASECPPTFGTEPSLVQGVIAGGRKALVEAIEGAEDLPELGQEDVVKYGVKSGDVVVGIAASGRTPYVLGALQAANEIGAVTVSLSCNSTSVLTGEADVAINVVVGPEVVTGSTRLKAGTAQKMVLNMLTTGAMIRLGKVYGNWMVNVQATNHKLRERVKRIIMEVTGVSYEEASVLSEQSGGDARIAIVMQQTGLSYDAAVELLEQTRGRVREAIAQG
ncbi:N-acetylmuramic acid 6-phosphate etherase [Ammoniphilus sp. CFH 90114]|uniref:N-acetylmuramic acid 6-phosphate etherase n=1 Tax=Ammoniphilus sp. CFH 90114 TaxID=2493665 RepID=UPI00100F4A10|nr:N-acetylmuramic acid 6-phosphate etherase [Ammoniphilus sp. CFH 90114]RXT04291.1 N-acetylmuramic acid 6-phosphate etherase [Ammoniphilus sp. CFH 90114]